MALLRQSTDTKSNLFISCCSRKSPYLLLNYRKIRPHCNGCPHQRYVAVIPRVVVHQRGAVGHAGNLISIVPPGHDSSVFICILPEPVIRFTEIVQNVAWSRGNYKLMKKKIINSDISYFKQEKGNMKALLPVMVVWCQHYAGTGVGVAGDPRAVHRKHHQEHQH